MNPHHKTQTSATFKQMLWLVPFCCFMLGYGIVALMTAPRSFRLDSLVGLPLMQALEFLTTHNLNTRLLSTINDTSVPPATVLSHTPAAGSMIKSQQSVYLVVSTHPPRATMPDCHGMSEQAATLALQPLNCAFKWYDVPSTYPPGTCIGHAPPAGTIIDTSCIILYRAQPQSKPFIWPPLENKKIFDATALLAQQTIAYDVVHTQPVSSDHDCSCCTVIDSRPSPGTFICPRSQIRARLLVESV